MRANRRQSLAELCNPQDLLNASTHVGDSQNLSICIVYMFQICLSNVFLFGVSSMFVLGCQLQPSTFNCVAVWLGNCVA